jgi:hypothetical protein
MQSQQSPHALISGLISVSARHDVTRGHTQAVFRQRSAKTIQAFPSDTNFGAAEMANAAASSGDKMLGRQSPDGAVIDPNERRLQSSDGAVNQNIGNLPALYPLEQAQAINWLD